MADNSKAQYCYNCACALLQPGEEAGQTRTARMEELLRQNQPPLDVELPAFRKIAEDARATVGNWDTKIFQARQLLENLISARQRAQSHFEDAKSLLHPMRSIPNEILVEIFGHCISEIADDDDPDSLDPQAAPWLLTRVCHRWRELAINSPQLWTHLFIDFDRQMDHITDLQCAYKVGVFTDRSRGLPMSVYLGSGESIQGHPVLPTFEVSIPRWKSLELDLPRTSLQCLSGNHFSSLQKLILHDDFRYEWNISLDVFDSTKTPALRYLEVPTKQSWLALKHVLLPWSCLTSITCFPAFDADGLNCLRTLVNLEDLKVVIVSDEHGPIQDIVPIPKLRSLTIVECYDTSGHSKEFFSALVIPALSELILHYHATSVLHFPTSPLPLGNLIKLYISCEMNSHVENTRHILDFLALTHHVESLCLYDLNMTAEFVDGLNLDKIVDGLPARLPCLRVLDISQCGFAPTVNDFSPFVAMLYSRLPAVTVEAKHGAEEIVDASCNPTMDGNGQRAATRTAFGARSGLDSQDHRRCLKEVQIPRRLYVQMRREWPDIFLKVRSMVDLKCGVTIEDMDS